MLSQTVTKGSAPSLSGMAYDVENRLTQVTHSADGADPYAYDPNHRRIWKKKPNGSVEWYFYGVSGEKLGTYSGMTSVKTVHTNLYFAGKLVWTEGAVAVTDRLGSEVSGGRKYFPDGEEPTTTTQDRTKFATYYRDNTTALDYAVNRYYRRTIGRFLSPDPYRASRGPADPQSWNRYSYVQNDPVNYNDPIGLLMHCPIGTHTDETGRHCAVDPVLSSLAGFQDDYGDRSAAKSNDDLISSHCARTFNP